MGALISRRAFAIPANIDTDEGTLQFMLWLKHVGQLPEQPGLVVDALEKLQAMGITSIACRLESTGFVVQMLAHSEVQYQNRAARFYAAVTAITPKQDGEGSGARSTGQAAKANC